MSRNFGLDVLRCAAIVMVLVFHSYGMFQPYLDIVSYLVPLGIFGVELFFVLSGYLIGQILLKSVVPNPSATNIFIFYIRRWFRTLPAYYLMILILMVADHFQPSPYSCHWPFYVFWQNFTPQSIGWFGVSWSLAIEEWFYLLTPVLLCVALPRNCGNDRIIKTLAAIIGTILVLRMAYVACFDPSWDFGTRKFVPLRFDSLLLGVLLAQVKLAKPRIYALLCHKRVALASIACLVIMGVYVVRADLDHSYFARTIFISLMSVCMAALLPYFELSDLINKKLAARKLVSGVITKISLYSYIMYLIHAHAYLLFENNTTTFFGLMWRLAAAFASVYVISAIVHVWFEKPIMDLRDKIQVFFVKEKPKENLGKGIPPPHFLKKQSAPVK
ncbi:MAG TPA: acyltransferase [Thermoguttaceae bacterium]